MSPWDLTICLVPSPAPPSPKSWWDQGCIRCHHLIERTTHGWWCWVLWLLFALCLVVRWGCGIPHRAVLCDGFTHSLGRWWGTQEVPWLTLWIPVLQGWALPKGLKGMGEWVWGHQVKWRPVPREREYWQRCWWGCSTCDAQSRYCENLSTGWLCLKASSCYSSCLLTLSLLYSRGIQSSSLPLLPI